MKANDIRDSVRQNYAKIARERGSGCGCDSKKTSCCSGAQAPRDTAAKIGYSAEELDAVPEGANLGLGCGNPQAIAALRPGETVLDLGSGGGFDCFLAAQRVGPTGKVIGVDMTPDMISKARANAEIGSYTNVEFRLGEIEALPVADGVVDAIMSNCVINLSPEKPRVYSEAFRVLKPGGRLAISDVVALKAMPEEILNDIALLSGCVAGAALVDDLEKMLREAGFTQIKVDVSASSRETIREWAPGRGIEDYVASAIISAVKG